jgi:hypothetical protein
MSILPEAPGMQSQAKVLIQSLTVLPKNPSVPYPPCKAILCSGIYILKYNAGIVSSAKSISDCLKPQSPPGIYLPQSG